MLYSCCLASVVIANKPNMNAYKKANLTSVYSIFPMCGGQSQSYPLVGTVISDSKLSNL